MRTRTAEALVRAFEEGRISRRQLANRLMGLGAAMAAFPQASRAAQEGGSTFQATGLDHIALDVTDVPRSRDFYIKHLGLEVIREEGEDSCFLGRSDGFFLTLFRGEEPGLNHYCYSIDDYDVDEAERKLKEAGLEVRRTGGRVYFQDPDGIEVQVSGA